MLDRRVPHLCALLAAVAIFSACLGDARALHKKHLRLRRAMTTEPPAAVEAPQCENLTDYSADLWQQQQLSQDEVAALLSAFGGLPGEADVNSKFVEEPAVLPFLSRDPFPFGPEDDDDDDLDALLDLLHDDASEEKDVKDKNKDGAAKDTDEDGGDKGGVDPRTAAKDEKDGDDEEDEDDVDLADEGVVDYFPDFFSVNPEESAKYNYSASDFRTFIRVERAITIPRQRLVQATRLSDADLAALPDVVEGVVGELWWRPPHLCRLYRNLAYVALRLPARTVTRAELKKKHCVAKEISLWCLGPDAAAPFNDQGSDAGTLDAEAVLGLPVHVRADAAAATATPAA